MYGNVFGVACGVGCGKDCDVGMCLGAMLGEGWNGDSGKVFGLRNRAYER